MRRNTLLLLAALAACTNPRISAPRVALAPLPEPVQAVALAPSGGVMADAVGTALFNHGVHIIDTAEMSNWLVRSGLEEIELLQPKSLTAMHARGITAVLSARSVAGYDGRPQSISVRVVSTKTGELIAAANWQNGAGGARGSPADGMMRVDVMQAAEQIGDALARQLGRGAAP